MVRPQDAGTRARSRSPRSSCRSASCSSSRPPTRPPTSWSARATSSQDQGDELTDAGRRARRPAGGPGRPAEGRRRGAAGRGAEAAGRAARRAAGVAGRRPRRGRRHARSARRQGEGAERQAATAASRCRPACRAIRRSSATRWRFSSGSWPPSLRSLPAGQAGVSRPRAGSRPAGRPARRAPMEQADKSAEQQDPVRRVQRARPTADRRAEGSDRRPEGARRRADRPGRRAEGHRRRPGQADPGPRHRRRSTAAAGAEHGHPDRRHPGRHDDRRRPDTNDLGAADHDACRPRSTRSSSPAGVAIETGGASEDQAEAFRQLGLAMVLAIVHRLHHHGGDVPQPGPAADPARRRSRSPPPARSPACCSPGTPLGVPAMVGLLMLIGIVVTNAIVLIDLINRFRARGEDPRTAVVDGARLRLRPIIMTATATICALIPMGLGLTGGGAFIGKPLAVVVIGGLVSSTHADPAAGPGALHPDPAARRAEAAAACSRPRPTPRRPPTRRSDPSPRGRSGLTTARLLEPFRPSGAQTTPDSAQTGAIWVDRCGNDPVGGHPRGRLSAYAAAHVAAGEPADDQDGPADPGEPHAQLMVVTAPGQLRRPGRSACRPRWRRRG